MHTALLFVTGITSLKAVSDCYFPFLEYHLGICNEQSDCGDGARCIYSLNLMKRICCHHKSGTVQPKCPYGFTDTLHLPVLCDPNTNTLDACPEGYNCVPSETDFTKENQQSNYICCKKD